MENRFIELSNKKLNNFIETHEIIGKGTEGTCYKVGNEVYKIYHEIYEPVNRNDKTLLDSNGVRIYKRSDFKKFKNKQTILQYKDEEGVSLPVKEGLNRALDKGMKIIGTRLPSKIITVRGRVKGCVYPYYDHTKSIYKSFRKRYKTRLKICKSLIAKVQELINYNIYPIDLCNKNKTKIYDKNDNNVLLGRKNEPIIIDLEGKSTLYTDKTNPQLVSKSYYALLLLILEILTKEALTTPIEDDEVDEVNSILLEFGLNEQTIDNIISDNVSVSDISDVMKIAHQKCK